MAFKSAKRISRWIHIRGSYDKKLFHVYTC